MPKTSPIMVAGFLGLVGVLQAEDAVQSPAISKSDDQLIVQVSNLAKDIRQRCEFVTNPPGNSKLIPHPEPILRWSNPTAGKVFGDVCVWTDNGRPKLVACIYRFYSPDWGATFELSSLASEGLVGKVRNEMFWTPASPGYKRERLDTSDIPADSAAARLVQMRRLASQFNAQLEDTRRTDNAVARQLRLLTQPIFRYASPASVTELDYVDGALFAFVEATDPEVLLTLEAIRTSDSVRWEYGLARMNRDAIRVMFRGQPVWSAPYLKDQLSLKTEPYTLYSLDQAPFEQK